MKFTTIDAFKQYLIAEGLLKEAGHMSFDSGNTGATTTPTPQTDNDPGFTITGEYEGEPQEFSGEMLADVLATNFKIAQDAEDFVNKVTYHITDSTGELSPEDELKLTTWYMEQNGEEIDSPENSGGQTPAEPAINPEVQEAYNDVMSKEKYGIFNVTAGWDKGEKTRPCIFYDADHSKSHVELMFYEFESVKNINLAEMKAGSYQGNSYSATDLFWDTMSQHLVQCFYDINSKTCENGFIQPEDVEKVKQIVVELKPDDQYYSSLDFNIFTQQSAQNSTPPQVSENGTNLEELVPKVIAMLDQDYGLNAETGAHENDIAISMENLDVPEQNFNEILKQVCTKLEQMGWSIEPENQA